MASSERDQEAKDRERYTDLAERLAAAWISSQQGLAGIDYALKRYVRDLGQPIGLTWIRIAKHVAEIMTKAMEETFTPMGDNEN